MNIIKMLTFFIAVSLVAGCATATPKKLEGPRSNSNVAVTFPADYQGRPLTADPITWPEFYDGGTYLYRNGRYSKATEYFLNAADISTGEAQRTCLAAAAISAMASGDAEQFISIRQQLRDLTEDEPFKEPTVTDMALESIEKINRF